MGITKKLIWILLLVLFSSLASAAVTYDLDLECYDTSCSDTMVTVYLTNDSIINASLQAPTPCDARIKNGGVLLPYRLVQRNWSGAQTQDLWGIQFIANITANSTADGYQLEVGDGGASCDNVTVLNAYYDAEDDLEEDLHFDADGAIKSDIVAQNDRSYYFDNLQYYQWSGSSNEFSCVGWFYDAAPGLHNSWIVSLYDDATQRFLLGMRDGNSGTCSAATEICYATPAVWAETGINQALGWWKWKILVNATGYTIWLNDTLAVTNVDAQENANKLRVTTNQAGDRWDQTYCAAGYDMNLQDSPPNYALTIGSTDIDLVAVDDFNTSSINNFSAEVDFLNGTVNTYSTSNGTVSLRNLGNFGFNISVLFFNATNYFNLSVYNQSITPNVTNTITVNMYQAFITMLAREKVSNASLSGATFYTGTKTGTTFNITAGDHNITAERAGYDNNTQEFTIAALTNTTITVTDMSYANLTIYVKDAVSGLHLSSYDLDISSIIYSNWTGDNVTGVTNHSWDLINDTFIVSVELAGYSSTNTTANITVGGDTNYTFFLRESNTLNISIYNETSNTLLNNLNISMVIVDPTGSADYWTENGTLYITGLTAGEVQILYEDTNGTAEGRTYYVQLSNNTYQEIRLYLLDTEISDLITLDLVDQDGRDVENATIKALRFYPIENLFRTVAMTKSNFNGQGTLDLVKKTTQANVFYKFIVEIDGEVKQETDQLEITADILFFTVDIQGDVFTSWDGIENVQYSLTYSNTTNQFSFTWSDTTNLVRDGCLKVLEHTPLRQVTICNLCTVSTTATLLCNITNTGNLFVANGLIETNTNNSLYTVATASWNFDQKYAVFGTFGLLLAFLFIATMAMVGIWNPVVAVIMTLVGLLFSTIIGLVYLTWASIITIIILGLIAVFKMRT